MKKTICCVILVLATISCAPLAQSIREYTDTERQAELATKGNPPATNDLLLGLYYYSLITNPSLTYPMNYNYLSNSYCPPSIWNNWSALQKSLWLESCRESDLRDYEYSLKRIRDRETWNLEDEARRIINLATEELRRAKRAKE